MLRRIPLIVEKLLFCRTLLLADLYEEGKSLVEILCHEGRQVKTQTFLIAFNESFYNVLHFSGVNVLWLALPEECTTSLVNFHKRRMEELWLFISSGPPLLPR